MTRLGPSLLRAGVAPALAGLVAAGAAVAAESRGTGDPLLDAVVAEIERAATALSGEPDPPYWMEVEVVERRTWDVQAVLGAAGAPSTARRRAGDVDVRVGSPELDNTHKLRDASWFAAEQHRPNLELPLDDAPTRATRMALWRALDESYRGAARRLIEVRANESVKVEREDPSPDFSPAPAVADLRDVVPVEVDLEAWRDTVRAASAVFARHPDVHDSNVSFHAEDDVRWIATTEGTRLRFQLTRLRVSAWGRTIADDGTALEVYDYVDARAPGRLPSRGEVVEMAERVARTVEALRAAPVGEPWVGPTILRGRAAAVFFHEILGHRVEGQRQKDEDESQTLKDKVGERILPEFIDIVDDPTLVEWQGIDLDGHYPYDDEGVPAERVTIVRGGVLEGFLMSRTPIRGFPRSNGHGRRQQGSAPAARQGNLVVTARETVPYERLREMLLEMVRERGLEYGMVIDDISGGFTFTDRSTPNSYSVQPVTAWRVYADGRPDELVRGVDLIGTPLITFSRIVAASDRTEVFNGMCGAESGWVPVAAIAPDLLVSEMELQRREKRNDRPPLLPPPSAEEGAAP